MWLHIEHVAQTYLSKDCEGLWVGILSLLVPVLCLQEAIALAVVRIHGAKIRLQSQHICDNATASMVSSYAPTKMNRS